MPPDPKQVPWWRDPLQTEPSPYEVFELKRNASLAEINAAASAKLGKLPQRSWKAARTALIQPVDRAVVDLFLYNQTQFAGSSISPERDPGCLGPAARAATQRQWLLELKERHPAPPLCHGIAIFSYWWAVHADLSARDRASKGGLPYANDVERNENGREAHRTLWRRAIGAWACLVEDDEAIRSALPDATEVTRRLACAEARQRVVRTLADSAGFWRGIGSDEGAAVAGMYEELCVQAAAESQSAREVCAAGVTFRGRRLVGGGILLRVLGLTTVAREALGAGASAISAYHHLAALVTAGEPNAALAAIIQLPHAERQQAEVRSVTASAHHALALRAASLNDFPKAVQEWGLALREADGAQRVIFLEGLVSNCRERGSQLSRRRSWDELIELLDRVLEVTGDEESLKALLVDALTSRGIQRVVQQQQRKERQEGSREEWLAASALGLQDVERAARLGGRRAIDELSTIRGWMKHLEELGLPGAEMVAAAISAANRDDWDTAIDTLQAALDQFGSRMSAATRQRALANLSIVLGNRAYARLPELDRSGPRERNRAPLIAAFRDAQRAAAVDPTNSTAADLVRTLRAASYGLIGAGLDAAASAGTTRPSAPASRPTSGGGVGLFTVLAMLVMGASVLIKLNEGDRRPSASFGAVTSANVPASTIPATEIAAPAPAAALPAEPVPTTSKKRPSSKVRAPVGTTAGAAPPSVTSGSGEVVNYYVDDAVAVALVADLRRLGAALERGDESLAQRVAALKTGGDALDSESAKIESLRSRYERDGASDEQASSFSRRVRAYNASVTAFQSDQAAYEAEFTRIEGVQSDYDKKWAQLKTRAGR